ncbi:MAG TPA: peptidoglycan DD-metalloendopeptidase family protein [Gaiellaceae bacterium]|nr:peptidoglycan DD-metalloendopeptidase family protein [Gaiellaceae bacterium]
MARRLTLLLVLMAALAGPALAGDNYGQQKKSLDAKLSAVEAKIAAARAKESALNHQIGGLTSQIHSLEGRVGDMASHLSALRADLRLRQRRLTKLNQLYRLQTLRFRALKQQYTLAVQRLDQRLVAIYKQAPPTTVDLLLSAKSFQDVIDQIDYFGAIAAQDKRVAAEVDAAKRQIKIARLNTAKARQSVRQQERIVSARVQQQAYLVGTLVSSQHKLAGAAASKASLLAQTKAQERAAVAESDAIKAASAALEAKIAAAQSGNTGAPASASAAGFIWPVSGPITSPFGPRWGSFHPGIDIGVPTGTPIHAAAAGTVLWCGWEEGYGNLVVIDHHNGLATAYGHQSRILVSCDENVAQGQTIGLSGCTGYCTGPHVHFEVRVNGKPVDPLGYLP